MLPSLADRVLPAPSLANTYPLQHTAAPRASGGLGRILVRHGGGISTQHSLPAPALPTTFPIYDFETNALQNMSVQGALRRMNVDNFAGVPTVNEQTGYLEHRPDVLAQTNAVFADAMSNPYRFRMRGIILNMPVGYCAPFNLNGWTLGLLCWYLCNGNYAIRQHVLDGLYISGRVRIFTPLISPTSFNPANMPDVPAQENRTSAPFPGYVQMRYFEDRQCFDVPLSKVDWASFSPAIQAAFQANSAMNFEDHLTNCLAADGGSRFDTYILISNSWIVRRPANGLPPAIKGAIRVIRTGALSTILLEDFSAQVSVRGEPFTFFCPSGEKLCVFAAIEWGYVQWRYAETTNQPPPPPLQQEEMMEIMETEEGNEEESEEDRLRRFGEEVRYMFEEFDHHSIVQMASKSRYREPAERGSKRYRSYQRKYNKKRIEGFSNKWIKRLFDFLYDRFNVYVNMFYIDSKGYWAPRFQESRGPGKMRVKTSPPVYVSLVQIDGDGDVLSWQKYNAEFVANVDSHHSGSVHVIAAYPFLREPTRRSREFTADIKSAIEAPFKQHFEAIHKSLFEGIMSSESEVSQEHIAAAVNFQLSRYESQRAKSTLIFKPPPATGGTISTSSSASNGDKEPTQTEAYIYEKSHIPMVFAYDLETVGINTCADDSEIDPRFRPSNPRRLSVPIPVDPSDDDNCFAEEDGTDSFPTEYSYTRENVQIPFSFQWVAINLRDEEKFFQRKTRMMLEPNVYASNYAEEELRGHPSVPAYPEGRISDIILCPPQTELGVRSSRAGGTNYYLGSCVDAALGKIAQMCAEYETKKAFLFAHNGAGFDSYCILRYTKYPLKKILKTPRGVISFELDVDGVTMIFRDTKAHVPGSLGALCQGFNVPKSWIKLDYPIYMINGKNCYHPDVQKQLTAYGENDVLCLAYIVKELNRLIGNSYWNPAYAKTRTPPICQFITSMSMIKASMRNHFNRHIEEQSLSYDSLPKAVDLPILRTLLKNAIFGGRVVPFAKSLITPAFARIVNLPPDAREERQHLYQRAIENMEGCRVWDVTSLYPFVMSSCPMPTGKLYSLTQEQCEYAIESVHCDDCERLLTICPSHRLGLIPNQFAIIMVKNLRFDTERDAIRNYCPRKNKYGGLVYSREEVIQDENPIQSYTNIDLYWMRRQHCRFEIVSGFGFVTSMKFAEFINPAFQMRIEAKRNGNKTLSNFLKLKINGSYGVTVQRDIDSNWIIVKLPPDLLAEKDTLKANDRRLLTFLLSVPDSRSKTAIIGPDDEVSDIIHLPNEQSLIQLKKRATAHESFSELAPIQIGAAVLAYARHVLNLIMFRLSPYDILYTDTDSINLTESAYRRIAAINPDLFSEEADAPMGTYKNDVAENNGTNPIIIFAAIGTKKVKMYVTLNEEGDIKVFNTFKGMNPINYRDNSPDDNIANGDASIGDSEEEDDNESTAAPSITPLHMHPDFIEHKLTNCLLDILFDGAPRKMAVSQWKRRIKSGVEISTHIQSAENLTYLGFHAGLAVTKSFAGIIEHFIPHGFTGSYDTDYDFPFHFVFTQFTRQHQDGITSDPQYIGERGSRDRETRNRYFSEIAGWGTTPDQIREFFHHNPLLFPKVAETAFQHDAQYNAVVETIRKTYNTVVTDN